MAKTVLVYTNHFYPENFKVNEIVEAFEIKGYKVTVITCVPNYPSGNIYPGYGLFKKNKEVRGNVIVRRLPLITRGKGSKIRLLINYLSYFLSVNFYTWYLILKQKKYDVVFVHHTSPIFIAISPVLYKWFNRKSKLILWDLDIWPDTLFAVNVIKNSHILKSIEFLVKKLYKNFDHILVGSKSFVSIVENRVQNVPVSYFPNWAEDVFTKGNIIIPNKEHEFQLNGLKIMFAGNIGEAQDIKNIFETVKLLKDQNITWIFVGDGRMKNWLIKEIEIHGLKEKFVFYGNHAIEYMPYFFTKADIMLVTLKDEEIFKKTVPAKLQAYMAYGKPVVGMLSGEGAKIIIESECGWACESGEYNELSKIVLEIKAQTKAQLQTKGENGKSYFKIHFEKELRFNQLFQIID